MRLPNDPDYPFFNISPSGDRAASRKQGAISNPFQLPALILSKKLSAGVDSLPEAGMITLRLRRMTSVTAPTVFDTNTVPCG